MTTELTQLAEQLLDRDFANLTERETNRIIGHLSEDDRRRVWLQMAQIAKQRAEDQFDEAERPQLEGLIELEVVAMIKRAGFGDDARLADALEAMGGEQKATAEARDRVLKRLSWQP